MKRKTAVKTILIVIAGVLVTITLGANKINTYNEYTNNNLQSNILYGMANMDSNITFKDGSLKVTLKDENENYLESGRIKVSANVIGELLAAAADINSSSEGEVICQYIVGLYTYNYNKGEQPEDRRIKDLGTKVLLNTENDLIIPIPENIHVSNDELAVRVYIAIEEINGDGFKSFESITFNPKQPSEPFIQLTLGSDGKNNGSYVTATAYKEVTPLTVKEQEYREFEIKKYTTSNSLIDLNTNKKLISKATEMRAAADSEEEFIDNVYKLIKAMEYDYELFEENKKGDLYTPDLDSRFEEKKGICVDKSWMIAAMLRSQGIPTKIVDGLLEGEGGHSWNEVLIKGQWVHIDATAGAGLYGNSIGYEPLRVS